MGNVIRLYVYRLTDLAVDGIRNLRQILVKIYSHYVKRISGANRFSSLFLT